MPRASTNPERVKKDIGRRVAELRVERGLTQEQLAEAAGVSIKYVQRIESGRENLTIESLVNLANLLAVPMVELLAAPQSRRVPKGRPPSKPA